MFYHKQNDDTFANLPVQKSLLSSYQKEYFLQSPRGDSHPNLYIWRAHLQKSTFESNLPQF